MKLQLKADSRQWTLVDADKPDEDGNMPILGYYSTLSGALKGSLQILLRLKAKRARDLEKACKALGAELQNALTEVDTLAQSAVAVIEQLKVDSELLAREKAVRSRKKSG